MIPREMGSLGDWWFASIVAVAALLIGIWLSGFIWPDDDDDANRR